MDATQTPGRRILVRTAAAAAAALVVLGAGAVLWPSPERADPAPAAAGPDPVAVEEPTTTTTSDGTATVYYLLAEPVTGRPSLLTARTIPVADTGSPGYDALHALLTAEPPRGLTEGFNFALTDRSDPVVDVASVTHRDGVVEVDLAGSTHDPYPALDLCCAPESEAVVQQLVLTVQAALGTDDPVRFAERSIWFDRVPDLVEGDASLVVPPVGASSVADLGLATPPSPVESGRGVGVAGRIGVVDGCVTLAGRPVVWPHGWTAWLVRGRAVLLDGRGLLVAREGDRVLGGGVPVHGPGPDRCLRAGPGMQVVEIDPARR